MDTMNEMRKPYGLKFSSDIVFGVLLRRNPELCRRILEIVLDIKVRRINIIQNERHFEPGLDERGIRLDVYVEDDDATIYDVEMQTTDDRNLPMRTRYYQGAIDTDLLSPSQDYTSLRKTIILFICCFDPFHRNLPIYRFRYRAEEDFSLTLGDETEKVFVNADYVGELAKGELGSFLHFVTTEESTSAFTEKIAVAMDELNRSEEGRSLMTLEMKMREERRIAHEKGREEGRVEGRKEMVLEQLAAGDITCELAGKWLKLSPEEVAKLLEEYRNPTE